MPLQPPKRTAAGFFLALTPALTSPELRWTTAGQWADLSGDTAATWLRWSDEQRNVLLGELLSNGKWFSRPPRRDVLEPLFSPWVIRTMSGVTRLACKMPVIPGDAETSGRATWSLDGLLMTSTSIEPIWTVGSATPDDNLDRISLFGGGDDEDARSTHSGLREIQLEDIEDAPMASSGPAQIRSREWEARKFLAKERVREARLKAQIARHMASKEEARFYRLYGDLDDGESHFSDYDLSDTESEGGTTDGSDEMEGADGHV